MSRRRSQSVQKSPKSQSVRPNALDGLDRLLTTLPPADWLYLANLISPGEGDMDSQPVNHVKVGVCRSVSFSLVVVILEDWVVGIQGSCHG